MVGGEGQPVTNLQAALGAGLHVLMGGKQHGIFVFPASEESWGQKSLCSFLLLHSDLRSSKIPTVLEMQGSEYINFPSSKTPSALLQTGGEIRG